MNSLVRLVQHLFPFSVYSLVQNPDMSAMSSCRPIWAYLGVVVSRPMENRILKHRSCEQAEDVGCSVWCQWHHKWE